MTRFSLPWFQSIVGLVAGLVSIAGAAYSVVRLWSPPVPRGQLVAVVVEARSDRPVPAATVEVFTRDDALVTTLTAGDGGRASSALPEGTYRLRVSHPQFRPEARQVRVTPGQTTEVRVSLARRAHGASPVDQAARAVSQGVGAVERFFRTLGF